MRTYWVSFRLKQNQTYEARLKELSDCVNAMSDGGTWWTETTSFYLFSSSLDADSVAMHVKSAIDTKVDIAVVGATEYKIGRVMGAYEDDDIFKLVPFMKKV